MGSVPTGGPTRSPSRSQFFAGIVCLAVLVMIIVGAGWSARVAPFQPLGVTVGLALLGIAVCWGVLVWALGYRRATADEVDAVLAGCCWHVTRASLAPEGLVLDPARGRSRSRMFFTRSPWRWPARAVFLFSRPPDRLDRWFNTGTDVRLIAHRVRIEELQGPLYIRRDGAIASLTIIRIVPDSLTPPSRIAGQ